jgi:hypothetical protein
MSKIKSSTVASKECKSSEKEKNMDHGFHGLGLMQRNFVLWIFGMLVVLGYHLLIGFEEWI